MDVVGRRMSRHGVITPTVSGFRIALSFHCFAFPSGIEHDVAAKLQQVGFPFNQDRLELPLRKMSNAFVPPVETLSVNAVELAHADREIGLTGLDQQMLMIGHQAVGMADPVIATNHPGQCLEKQLAISVGKKYFLASVAAAGQMINGAGELQSKRARHSGALLSDEMCHRKT